MYVIKKISYDLDIVEQFIVPQFKCPYYKNRLMLTIDTKLVGNTCFYCLKIPLVMSLTTYPI